MSPGRRPPGGETRRLGALQVALGLAWVIDGALALQPQLLGAGLIESVRSNVMGEPGWVRSFVFTTTGPLAGHGAEVGVAVALAQLGLGAAIISVRTRRVGLALSVPWAIAIWAVGESFGTVPSGFAMLPSGAPGPALLYALAACCLFPAAQRAEAPSGGGPAAGPAYLASPAAKGRLGGRVVATGWSALLVTAAVLQGVPVVSLSFKLAANLQMAALGEPRWLARSDELLARTLAGHGTAVTAALIAAELVLAAAPWLTPRAARAVLIGGLVAFATFWVFGENLGELLTGSANDPGAMPLYGLIAASLLPTRQPPGLAAKRRAPAPGATGRTVVIRVPLT